MSRWFRLYDTMLDDPKVQSLDPFLFKVWVNLLCVASKNGGEIRPKEIPFLLRLREKDAALCIDKLKAAGLMDTVDIVLKPHNWEARQWASDDSKERVRKHREKQREKQPGNDDVTVTVTPPDTDTDTDTDTEKEIYKEKSSLRSEKQSLKKKVLKRTQIDENDYPDDRDVEVASRAGMSAVTLDLEWQRFRAHHMAKGSLMANWNQAWVTWVTNWKSFGSKQAQSGSLNGATGSKYDWSKELAELEREKNRGDKENRRTH